MQKNNKIQQRFKLNALIALLLSNGLVYAVTPQQLPSTVLPELNSNTLSTMPTANPRAETPAVKTQAPPSNSPLGAEAQKIKFKLTKIVLVDNTVFSADDLLPLYKDKLNKTISVAQLQEIVQSITSYYRNNGYILTRAILPPQKVTKAGIVKVQVIEGFIDHVNVVGTPKGAKKILEGYGAHIVMSKPLQLKVLEHYMLLGNELPGVQTKAVLEASKDKVGATDLNLVTQTKMFSGYFSYDNYGTLYIGPREVAAGAEMDSVFRSGDSTQLNFATATKPDQLKFLQLLHNTPLGTTGTRLIFSGNEAKTMPGLNLDSLLIDGTANTYYAMLQYPYIRSTSKNVTFDGSLNWIDSKVVFTTAQSTLYVDHLRTLRLGGSMNTADSWLGSNSFSAHLETGLPVFGSTSISQGNNPIVQTSRAGASNNFTRIEGELSRQQQLGQSRFSLYGIIKGQYAFQPLLASMQFGFGGVQQALGWQAA
jgi:hemolysin activation/secretion protein